jgi:hypothetical protein
VARHQRRARHAAPGVERPREADHRKLEHDQPQSPDCSKCAWRERTPATPARQADRQPGQEEERRRAKVRDPARREQGQVRRRHVLGRDMRAGEVVTRVLDRHQHHHLVLVSEYLG